MAAVREALARDLPLEPVPLGTVVDGLVAVLVRVGGVELTNRDERFVQSDGVCWLGATTWRGERLLRISVSNWTTTEHDIERTVDAIVRARLAALADPPA